MLLQDLYCRILNINKNSFSKNLFKKFSKFLVKKCELKWIKSLLEPEVDQILRYYRAYVEDKKPMEYILGHVDFF